jgi:hypothetical protein
MESTEKKSFVQQWGALVAFGVFAVVALVGFRLWTEHKANEPVAEAYASYLSHVALQSSSAGQYLQAYFKKHSRQTVASRHFEVACGAITVLADHDGIDPEKFSVQMARGCRMFQREGVTGDVP